MTDTAKTGESPPHRAFRLHSNCKFVQGMAYSAIYDLQRNLLFRFRSDYAPLFLLAGSEGGIDMSELAELSETARARALTAIDYMAGQELGDYVTGSLRDHILPLPERWDSPHKIINAIVDVDELQHDWAALFAALAELQCDAVQIRCFSNLLDPAGLRDILAWVEGSSIQRIEVLLKWTPDFEAVDWPEMFETFSNLVQVQLHSAPVERTLDTALPGRPRRQVRFRAAALDGPSCCGTIAEGTLNAPTVSLYHELKQFNGCLNRKVSIRADGEICNCPSMKAGFGKDLSRLAGTVASAEFQRPWRISKDHMEICRQCEFRYVCTDCRAYLESDVSRGKPARCSYDPSTGSWAAAATGAG